MQSDIGLGILCVLHGFWFFLMLKIAYKLPTGKKASQAGREEYEGASESDSDAGKKDK